MQTITKFLVLLILSLSITNTSAQDNQDTSNKAKIETLKNLKQIAEK